MSEQTGSENRYSRSHNIRDVLDSYGSDAVDYVAGLFTEDEDEANMAQAEARIRELIDQEESKLFHKMCDESMIEWRAKNRRDVDKDAVDPRYQPGSDW